MPPQPLPRLEPCQHLRVQVSLAPPRSSCFSTLSLSDLRQLCSTVIHVVSSVTWYDSLTRRSRSSLVSGSADECSRSRSVERRRTPYSSTSRLRRATRGCHRSADAYRSRIQLGVSRYHARSDAHHREAFSPLARSSSQLDKVPRRPLLVSTTAHQNALPVFSLARWRARKSGNLISVILRHHRGETTVRQLTRKCCRDLERITASSYVEAFF